MEVEGQEREESVMESVGGLYPRGLSMIQGLFDMRPPPRLGSNSSMPREAAQDAGECNAKPLGLPCFL